MAAQIVGAMMSPEEREAQREAHFAEMDAQTHILMVRNLVYERYRRRATARKWSLTNEAESLVTKLQKLDARTHVPCSATLRFHSHAS